MNTVIIWDDLSGHIRYAVLQGDLRHLDRIYTSTLSKQLPSFDTNELYSIMFKNNVQFLKDFPVDEVRNGAAVICGGYVP